MDFIKPWIKLNSLRFISENAMKYQIRPMTKMKSRIKPPNKMTPIILQSPLKLSQISLPKQWKWIPNHHFILNLPFMTVFQRKIPSKTLKINFDNWYQAPPIKWFKDFIFNQTKFTYLVKKAHNIFLITRRIFLNKFYFCVYLKLTKYIDDSIITRLLLYSVSIGHIIWKSCKIW